MIVELESPGGRFRIREGSEVGAWAEREDVASLTVRGRLCIAVSDAWQIDAVEPYAVYVLAKVRV